MKPFILFALLIVITFQTFSQTSEEQNSHLYAGLFGGLTWAQLEASHYFTSGGLLTKYNWNNEYLSFSYNHLTTLKLDNWTNDDYSNYNRFELCYGRITCFKENHKVFQHIFISGLVGVSYNSIRYYKDSDAMYFQNGSEISEIGFPLGLSITNSFGHTMFAGWEYKYHFVLHHMGYGEIGFILMAKIF